MKKLLSVVLSICMVLISVPVFATSSNEVVKVQLSDQAMAEAMGGGGVDTHIVSNAGGTVQALVVNSSIATCTYTVTHKLLVDGTGGVVLTSGTIAQNSSTLLALSPYRNLAMRISVSCATDGVPALTASSSAWVN